MFHDLIVLNRSTYTVLMYTSVCYIKKLYSIEVTFYAQQLQFEV